MDELYSSVFGIWLVFDLEHGLEVKNRRNREGRQKMSLVPYFLDCPFKSHTIHQFVIVIVERRIYHYAKSPYGAIRDVFVSGGCSQDQ